MESTPPHTQTEAETIAHNMCLLSCYAYIAGIEPTAKNYFNIAYDAMKAGASVSGVESECYIKDPVKFFSWLAGRRVTVTYKEIKNLNEIKEPAAVRFRAAGYTPHFVVVENGKIIFDGLQDSKSVKYGKPTDARIIKLA